MQRPLSAAMMSKTIILRIQILILNISISNLNRGGCADDIFLYSLIRFRRRSPSDFFYSKRLKEIANIFQRL